MLRLMGTTTALRDATSLSVSGNHERRRQISETRWSRLACDCQSDKQTGGNRQVLSERHNSTVSPRAMLPLRDRYGKKKKKKEPLEKAPTAVAALSRLCAHTFAIIVTAFLAECKTPASHTLTPLPALSPCCKLMRNAVVGRVRALPPRFLSVQMKLKRPDDTVDATET